MSGPVALQDTGPTRAATSGSSGPVLEVVASRVADVGGNSVRRALPRRGRRTVGAWCFLDHFGPAQTPMQVGPHPHIGLHTVTWLLEGEVLHTDSLGSEQLVRPGQLNLMTAGHGVVLSGSIEVDGEVVRPGALGYLGTGREELSLRTDEPTTALLIGGEPIAETLLYWWNYVARTRDEIDQAHRDWEAQSERFGRVRSRLARIPSPAPIWSARLDKRGAAGSAAR